ncbi:uncharacterized protein K04H4.2-like [Mizuhopecten yessoensis]|uniref:Uncharacterized protein n=1 Tax=Mizuhopecten yessoensis TaxID=6573 RepID=A0A210QZF3_MIZYE|nr:uncharacterized protein K04H4.2-like [Mizuhopecten yessoensis]OWF54143.1 hypothetical protein KP79_PYT18889 [Mizuhopecten yessoensis]
MLHLSFLFFGIASVHTVLTAEPCSTASNAACCSQGDPFTNEKGEQVSCSRGSLTLCPAGYSCFTNEVDKWAVCCPAEEVTPEPCSTRSDTACCTDGSPFTNENGEQVSCGGYSSTSCPNGYSCFTHQVDRWAVCCPSGQTVYGAVPAGYTGLKRQTVCWPVDPACEQMTYEKIDGLWYRGCDTHRSGC